MTEPTAPTYRTGVLLGSRAGLVASIVLAVGLSGSACSSLSISRDMVVPPKVKELHGRRAVFVGGFEGRRGGYARDRVLKELTKVDYHRIQTRIDNDTVVVQGHVSDDNYADHIKDQHEKRCAERDKKGKCTRNVNVRVFQRTQTCNIEFKLTAIDRRTGQLIHNAAIPRGRELTKFWDEGQEPFPQVQNELCEVAVDDAVDAAVERIAATTDDVDLDFHEVEGHDNATERAVSYVKQGRLNDAEALLLPLPSSTQLSAEERDWSRYNLALVYFAAERFDDCIGSLESMKGTSREARDVGRLRQNCVSFR